MPRLALKIAREFGVGQPQAAALIDLAGAHFARSETDDALSLAEEAFGLSRLVGCGLH